MRRNSHYRKLPYRYFYASRLRVFSPQISQELLILAEVMIRKSQPFFDSLNTRAQRGGAYGEHGAHPEAEQCRSTADGPDQTPRPRYGTVGAVEAWHGRGGAGPSSDPRRLAASRRRGAASGGQLLQRALGLPQQHRPGGKPGLQLALCLQRQYRQHWG